MTSSISLNLSKIPRLMQRLGDAYDSTIILSMALCAISTEKQTAQIGHLPAHEREQFRVICYLKRPSGFQRAFLGIGRF